MRMPNMNGIQLYKKLINLNPKLLFIMLSGFVEEITLEEDENTLILAKPITVKNIDLAIKKLLNI
jgi:two-component SAPR family response regulator